MLDNEFLKELSTRISKLLPMAASAREDVEKNVEDLLQKSFARLNLVTREEFDAQLKVLERAEQTIAALEKQVSDLEQGTPIRPPDPGENETS